MIQLLLLWLPLIGATLFALWAGLVALAAEGDPQLPRVLAAELAERQAALTTARTLHVVHLALLVLAAALGGFAIRWWSWPAAGAVTRLVLLVLLVWVVGDLVPRMFAAIAPEWVPVARRLAEPGLGLFRPLLGLVSFADRGIQPAVPPAPPGQDRGMLHGVFALGEMTVAEVMTPRLDIVAVPLASTRAEVVASFHRARHARLLVIDADPDNVVGVVYAKDLLGELATEGPGSDWHPLIRPALFVPEAKTLDRQLRDFQRGPSHMMVVVDEFGGTAGLITLEDILEQIVGEIHDEYDLDEVAPIQAIADGGWMVQGGVALSELEAVLGAGLGREDVNTVGGLVLAELGRVARVGDAVSVARYRFQVDQVVRRRIGRVKVSEVEVVPAPEPPIAVVP